MLTTALPLWQALLSQNAATMNRQPGFLPGPTRAAGLAGPAVMGGGGGAFDIAPAVQGVDLAARAQAPLAFLQQLAALGTQPLSPFYPPTIETEQVTEGPDNTFGELLGLAQLGVGIAGLAGWCWVADELYGKDSLQAFCARAWVTEGWQGQTADAFRWLYRRLGPRLAHGVQRSHVLRWLVTPLFDHFVEQGWRYWVAKTRLPQLAL